MAKKLAFDRALFVSIVLLVGFGLVMVYSASAAIARSSGAVVNPFLIKQAVATLVGLLLMLAVMHVDYRRLEHPAIVFALVGTTLAALVAVLFAPALNDAHRWLFFGGVSIQPSEFAKLSLVVFLAYLLHRRGDDVGRGRFLVPAGLLIGVFALLVFLEPAMSATVVLVAGAALLLFLGGLAWRFVFAAALLAVPVAGWLVWMAPYRRVRILSFLRPEEDPLGAGFQATQSLIAVGSGGLTGLGLGHGAQKLYFLPYPHTDFIYSIVAEELGFLGATALLGLFALFAWRGAKAGLAAGDRFGRFLAWGLTGIIVLQALLHFSVALSLLPSTGIPLPFVTYGGSAMVATLIACGVILNVSQHG